MHIQNGNMRRFIASMMTLSLFANVDDTAYLYEVSNEHVSGSA